MTSRILGPRRLVGDGTSENEMSAVLVLMV